MRRSMNGARVGSNSTPSKQSEPSTMTRRSTLTEEQRNGKGDRPSSANSGDDNGFQGVGAGPVTARLKMLEKRYAQVLEMQAKFGILDKWLQQQFGVKLFPSCKVNSERFSENNPEDSDNPFYAVYLVVQRVKFLEEKVKKLEARSLDDGFEQKPTSNYCSATAFRNLRGGKAGGVKRGYGSPSPATPKKAKMMPRPVVPPTGYPFKPSVKILPKDMSASVVIKKEIEDPDTATPGPSGAAKTVSPTKSSKEVVETPPATGIDDKSNKDKENEVKADSKTDEADISGTPKEKDVPAEASDKMDTNEASATAEAVTSEEKQNDDEKSIQNEEKIDDDKAPEIEVEHVSLKVEGEDDETGLITPNNEEVDEILEDIPVLEDATAMPEDSMEMVSDQDEADMEVEQKPDITGDEEILGDDVSGSEASVSSLTSSNSKPRLSARRQAAGAVAASTEDEKPVMYTTRGRRHTVPRRYAEFTGHDNVVSILKSQQRAEKSAAASASKAGRKSAASMPKVQDSPPKIKKMVKTSKTPSPKKAAAALLIDSDDGEPVPIPGKKKSSTPHEKPACVDALVERVMAREVDSDGMVVLSESYPNIYVNRQQLIMVVVRSNGKSTRLTRKMTTLVFEDSVLASASPFGTKYYKDRLPPEPLEAMVDFIADSGFEPHYSKKKIYMIVGQVCNEARAGRVSRKYMQPMEGNPGPSGSQQSVLSEDPGSPDDTDLASTASETPQSSQNLSQ